MSAKVTQLDKEIAERIRKLRLDSLMSQPTVAGVLGVTYQSYQKMEGGLISFRASTLARLAQMFGVPVNWFYGNSTVPVPNGAEASHVSAMIQQMSGADAKDVLAHALKVKRR